MRMKKEILIQPAMGIEWMQGKIRLNEQWNMLQCLGLSFETIRQSAYLFQGDLRVDFDSMDVVEFIEVRGGEDSVLRPVFCEISLFEKEVSKVLDGLKKSYTVEERENGYSYVIPDLEMALWRERTEADVEQFIKDMKADGVEVEENPDVEAEWKLAKRFAAVSIGRKGYFG